MTVHRNLYTLGALLLLSSVHVAQADAPNPIEFMAQLAKGVENLGKNTLCVADLGENPEIVARAYKAFDGTVAGVKANVNGPLSEEQFASLVKIIVVDTGAAINAVDPTCKDVSKYCSASDPPPAAKTLSELGKALETMGATLGCLVADPKPEILAKIPIIMGAAIQKVAQTEDANRTSVGILLPEIIKIAYEFQQLSSSCGNAVKSC